jgi:signal transduction histidine kinase
MIFSRIFSKTISYVKIFCAKILGLIQRLSLLYKILLSTSITTTVLFALTAWFVNQYVFEQTEQGVVNEVHSSLREYQFLWQAKANDLSKISLLMSTMSDVRAAFSTGDAATIRDSAGDLWRRVSRGAAVFLVVDPHGNVIATLGGEAPGLSSISKIVPKALLKFPDQVSGFVAEEDKLYYLLLTPVYVQSGDGQALINILAAGFRVDDRLAVELRGLTEGSEFVFLAHGRVMASSVPTTKELSAHRDHPEGNLVSVNSTLSDITGKPMGELRVMRSIEKSLERFRSLRTTITSIWIATLVAGLLLSYILTSRIVWPVKALDSAAAEIANRNYQYRVTIHRQDELGRLGQTFNSMCDSIELSRKELIAQERLNAVGRVSSSIVHDLRNPLAAIYGGSEMLVDNEDMPPEQAKRLAANIYRASRRIQQLLQDLGQNVKGMTEPIDVCSLFDVVDAAREVVAPAAAAQGVQIVINIPNDLELSLYRSRIERVFLNLMSNSVDAMPNGGRLEVRARHDSRSVLIEIDDTGVGLSDSVRRQLFQPFFSSGKRNGLGLGLALSRRTVLAHGGELWAAEKDTPGARFCLRLPLGVKPDTVPAAEPSASQRFS